MATFGALLIFSKKLYSSLYIHCLVQGDTLTGRVVRVSDGDTVVILGSGNAMHKIGLMA